MEKGVKLLEVVDGETLMDMQFPKSRFCIHSLLPQGVSILGVHRRLVNHGWYLIGVCGLQKENLFGTCRPKAERFSTSVLKTVLIMQ